MSNTQYPVYMLVTEEGVEVIGSSALEVLKDYLDISSPSDEWIDNFIDCKSEIVGIMKKTKEEYKEWLAEAIET